MLLEGPTDVLRMCSMYGRRAVGGSQGRRVEEGNQGRREEDKVIKGTRGGEGLRRARSGIGGSPTGAV